MLKEQLLVQKKLGGSLLTPVKGSVLIAILFTKLLKVLKTIPFYKAIKVISEIEFQQKIFSFFQKPQNYSVV